MSFSSVIYGHGVKPEKAQKALSKLASTGAFQPGEYVRLFVKCNNFRPLVSALLVTNARLLAASTSAGDTEVKFAVGLDELGPLEPDEKGRNLTVSSPRGSPTFKAIPPRDIPVLVDHLKAGPQPTEDAHPSESGGPATPPSSAPPATVAPPPPPPRSSGPVFKSSSAAFTAPNSSGQASPPDPSGKLTRQDKAANRVSFETLAMAAARGDQAVLPLARVGLRAAPAIAVLGSHLPPTTITNASRRIHHLRCTLA